MTNGNQAERQASQSSDKLLLILEKIAESRLPVRLQELAERTELTQPTVLRYLRTLQNAGYVYQEESTSRYALTWKLCRLTENVNSYISLRNIASPYINYLANTLERGVCLVVNRENECVYLDCVDDPNSRGVPLQYIGKRAPLHVTGSGKLLLSAYSEEQVDGYIAAKGLTEYTRHTITERSRLMDELEFVRSRGYAMDAEECEIGLKCVSYPIYCYTGKIYAAISVFGSTENMSDAFIVSDVCPALSAAAETISERLGYSTH